MGGSTAAFFSDTNIELRSLGTRSYHTTLLGLTREVAGAAVTAIVRHPDTAMPVSESQAGVKRFFLQDALGSTTGMLDAAGGGSIARSFTYTPDGVDTTTGSGPTTNLRFAGGHRLAGTPLYHFGARFYDPTIARWTQQDPLEQYDDLRQANRYVYVGANPVNYVDPLGRSIWDDAKKAFGAVAKKAPAACYVYNAATDEEDDIGDELYDLNECFNPVSWVD